ncbi:MAG: hypothetical protein ACRDQ5_23520 [Sciscionella sp.]
MRRQTGFFRVRQVRYGSVTTTVVLLICLIVAGMSARAYLDASGELGKLTARATGEVTQYDSQRHPDVIEVGWQLKNGKRISTAVPLAGSGYPVGTRTEIAYDPHQPRHAIIPGAKLLVVIDRASSGVVFGLLVALIVAAVTGWVLLTRSRLRRLPTRQFELRRVRFQRGLLARSWLELDDNPQRWIPVYFEPELMTLPSPATGQVHGDPRRNRLVAVQAARADGSSVLLYPSGGVARNEPRGRRLDNPTKPDDHTTLRAARAASLGRQLRVDAPLIVPAPFVGAFWAFVDDSGFEGWLGATAVTAALGLWVAAIRGSDPS